MRPRTRVRFPPPPLSPQIAGFRWRRELIVPLAVGVCLSGGSECVHRSFEVALVLVSVDSERRGQVAVPESLRGGFDARNPTEVGCERVTRPVHVEAGANAVADEAACSSIRYHQQCTVLGAHRFFGSAQ